MRNYSGRLAKLEAALKPPETIVIKIVYVDGDDWTAAAGSGQHVNLSWGDEPIARVAPGLLELLQDDTAVTPPAAVSSPPGDDADPQPDEQEMQSWSFERARHTFRWEQAQAERAERHRERRGR